MEIHDGSSGYEADQRVDGDFLLYPFIIINGYKENIGTNGITFNNVKDCIESGDRWMKLDRGTQLAMRTNPDYNKFVQ